MRASTTAAGLCVCFLSEGASCFAPLHLHARWPLSSPCPSDVLSSASYDGPCDDALRQEAADALLPVFFPTHRLDARKPAAAENALKRLLRKKYQWRASEGKSGANASRGRLAALILGTSVMRLRHWYAIANQNRTVSIPIPYPLDNIVSVVDGYDAPITEESGHSAEEMSLVVRAMVDEQARYLSMENDAFPLIHSGSAIDLSLQYSLPPSLTIALLSHYGWNETKQICSLMNQPGPITLRRNAVRFPGTDEEMCKWLRDEDGIHAEPLASLLEGGRSKSNALQQSNVPIMSEASGRSRRCVMRSISTPGSVLPPDGAIRIVPPKENATTSVEQRRNQKSIWSMTGWQNGYFEVQDAGSQLIVQSLELSPGESVLDYCAGNGGKTFAIASRLSACMKSSLCSHIVAHDVVEDRLRQIKGSLLRVGFEAEEKNAAYNETIYTSPDGECSIRIASTSDLDVTSSFDAVLVDAPCSSSGVLRRRPSQRWDLTEEHVFGELPELQLQILESAAAFVSKNGGRLVYSTCSLLQQENEAVARKLEQSDVFLSGGFVPWNFDAIANSDADLGAEQDEEKHGSDRHFLTLLPSETSDGFFIARWKRKII